MKLKEKLKNYRKAIAATISSLLILFTSSMTAFADVNSALTQAKTNVVNQVKPAFNNAVIPIILILLVGYLIFAIAHAVWDYRKNRQVELGWIIAIIIGVVLLGTFSVWGWSMVAV